MCIHMYISNECVCEVVSVCVCNGSDGNVCVFVRALPTNSRTLSDYQCHYYS